MHWPNFARRTISAPNLLLGLGVASSLFVAAFDSFRLSSASDRMGADAVGALLAPLYPAGHSAAARDTISVLLLTDGAMQRIGVDTPFLPYNLQADLVRLMAPAHPKAIFFDFTYRRARSDPGGLGQFADAVAEAKAAGVPVILGQMTDDAAFARLKADATEADVRWIIDQPLDYPFAGLRGKPTPANLIYSDLCATAEGRTRYACDLRVSAAAPAIAVEWARGAASGQQRWWGAAACDARGGDVWQGFFRNLTRNLFRRVTDATGGSEDACTYHASAPVDAVLSESTGDAAIAALVAGKVVMIGSALGDDSFDAPGQGVAPGVLHHAMALDNLLVRGAHYQRWPQEIGIGPARIGLNNLVEIALSIGIGLGAAAIMRRRDKADAAGTAWTSAVAVLLAVTVPVAVAVLSRLVFSWPAVNAFGVAAGALGVTTVLEHERFGLALGQLTVRLAAAGAAFLAGVAALLIAIHVAPPAMVSIAFGIAAGFVVLGALCLIVGRAPEPLEGESR